jgi:PAS domain S-box-containing protein
VNAQAYALLGLTALVAVLVAVVAWALLRFVSAARDTRHRLREPGESTMLTVALQDAVQKMRAQERAMTERAEASEALSTQIVNSLTAGLLVVDHQGLVQILNPAARRMLGVTGSVEGLSLSTLPPAAAPLAAVVNECMTTGNSIVRRALEVPHANDVTHLGVTANRLEQSEGNSGGVICLFSDLTAVIELEEQLRLKEALARLGELTAGIAHEFRNGLATIHGYGKLIDPAALPAAYKPYIEGIRQETDALGQVVTNFLNFARPTQLSLATYDLATLVRRAADDL